MEELRTKVVGELPFGLWCVDFDLRIMTCDKKFREIAGIDNDVLSFDHLPRLIRSDYRNVVMMLFGEMLERGSFDMTFPMEEKWVHLELVKLKVDEHKAIGYITEAKNIENNDVKDKGEMMLIVSRINQLMYRGVGRLLEVEREDVLNEVLSDLLNFLGADRISMLKYDDLKCDISCTNGATRYGVESRMGVLKDLTTDSIPWIWGNVMAGKMTIIEDVTALTQDPLLEVDALCNYNAKTMVIQPLLYKERILGFFIVDFIMAHHDVLEHEKEIIKLLSRFVEFVICTNERERRQHSEREQLSAVVKNAPLGYLNLRITYNQDNMPEDMIICKSNTVFERMIQVEGIVGKMASEIMGKESKHLMQVCHEVSRSCENAGCKIVDDFLYCNGMSLSAIVMTSGYNEYVCFATSTSSILYALMHNLSSGMYDTQTMTKELQHKIRTYLNTIVGFSELMSEESDDSVKHEYMKIIKENAAELLDVTNIKDDSDMDSQKTNVAQEGAEKEVEKPTILVAEDTESNYMLVSYILKNEYNLVWAHDGLEALELYEKTKPDLILMDVRMPRLGGLSATSKIREKDKTTPIIALTAFAFESDKSKTLDAGCTDFLSKPINVSVLKSTVGKYLKK